MGCKGLFFSNSAFKSCNSCTCPGEVEGLNHKIASALSVKRRVNSPFWSVTECKPGESNKTNLSPNSIPWIAAVVSTTPSAKALFSEKYSI